jgi:hypothetical protein
VVHGGRFLSRHALLPFYCGEILEVSPKLALVEIGVGKVVYLAFLASCVEISSDEAAPVVVVVVVAFAVGEVMVMMIVVVVEDEGGDIFFRSLHDFQFWKRVSSQRMQGGGLLQPSGQKSCPARSLN